MKLKGIKNVVIKIKIIDYIFIIIFSFIIYSIRYQNYFYV